MTRGTFILITEDENFNRHFYMSTEFNGIYELKDKILQTYNFENIHSIEDWKKYIDNFNKEHFQYDDEWIYGEITEENKNNFMEFEDVENIYDLYSWNYHTDFTYILNLSDDVIEIKADNGIVSINDNGGAVFNYDDYMETFWDSRFIDPEDSYDFEDDAWIYKIMNENNFDKYEATEWYNSGHYKKSIYAIYDDYESLGVNVADNSYGLPEWASNYFDYEEFGKDLITNSDGYYELCSGRIVSYEC